MEPPGPCESCGLELQAQCDHGYAVGHGLKGHKNRKVGMKKRHEFKPKLINVAFLKGEILQLDDRFFYSSHKV